MHLKPEITSKIQEVAYKRFARSGYKHTTMDDIAQDLGMSKKTLYQYFPGKMELLEASIEKLKSRLSTKVETILENEHLPFLVKLKSMLSAIAADLALINPEFLEDMQEHAPAVWTSFQDYIRSSAYLRFQRLVQEGIDQGLVASHVDKSVIVLLYAAAIQNLLDTKFLRQFPHEMIDNLDLAPSKMYDQAISIVFEGILSDEARKEFKENR